MVVLGSITAFACEVGLRTRDYLEYDTNIDIDLEFEDQVTKVVDIPRTRFLFILLFITYSRLISKCLHNQVFSCLCYYHSLLALSSLGRSLT